jgi:hypothetical protein
MQTYKRRLSFHELRANGNNDIFKFLPDIKEHFLTESVRGGLEAIIDKLWANQTIKVLLPVFIAEGAISPFKKKGVSVIFYRLNEDLSPNLDDIENKLILNPEVKCLLVVHYFGFAQDLVQIKEICKKNNCLLLEDCVHALFSKDERGKYLGYQGDISFFSFAKILPVPDGGIFFINNLDISPLLQDIRYKRSLSGFLMVRIHLLYLLLKNEEVKLNYSPWYRVMNFFTKAIYWTYYRFLNSARKPQHISSISLKILKNIDFNSLIDQRRNHISEIYQVLLPKKHLLFCQLYNPNSVLTGVPLVVKDCERIVSELWKNNVECLSYKKSWFYIPRGKEYEYKLEFDFYQNHFLLPIHEADSDYTKILTKLL